MPMTAVSELLTKRTAAIRAALFAISWHFPRGVK